VFFCFLFVEFCLNEKAKEQLGYYVCSVGHVQLLQHVGSCAHTDVSSQESSGGNQWHRGVSEIDIDVLWSMFLGHGLLANFSFMLFDTSAVPETLPWIIYQKQAPKYVKWTRTQRVIAFVVLTCVCQIDWKW